MLPNFDPNKLDLNELLQLSRKRKQRATSKRITKAQMKAFIAPILRRCHAASEAAEDTPLKQ